MTTTNTVIINEIPVDPTDPTKTAWGPLLSAQYFFALVNGTGADETFDAADINGATLTRMAAYKRGISVVMGAGNDTVTGSAYGDTINAGTGTNHIDGGANEGSTPDGGKARDVLNVFAADAAAAAALQVTEIAADAAGADGQAYAAGYRIKVSNGLETDYLKNVEQINVFRADQNNAYVRTIMLALDVREIGPGQDVAGAMHHAWVQGTDRADSFDAQADVSSATQALMAQHGRGVYVDMGAGNDTVVGSGFGDNIVLGSGTNYADGGLNAGSTPWGGKPQDVLHVIVANAGAAAAVQVVQLGAGMSGLDAQAFTNGYTHKVVAGGEIDYIKGIERVSVQVANGSGGSDWVRDIPLETVVHEADLAAPNLADYMHLAWASGTAGNDTINAADLLSDGVKAKMAALQKGVWIDGGSGNDIITGSAYGDNFRNGSGNAKIDGGANAGGMDVFEISVDSTAAMAAVQVVASDDPAYTWMVSYGAGTQKDYLKNIEAIMVNVAGTSTGKWIPLAVQLHEISADGNPAASMHHAWAQGTDRDDSFDAASVSNATKALMTQHGRGVYVDMGAGNDTVVGSGYGDDITLGSGTNYADGGLNAGSTPWGGKPQDVLHVIVANAGAAAAVQVVQLGAGLGGLDAQAFANGYTHKVVAGSEIDYIKGIERVSVELAGGTWVRDIALETVVHEADLGGNLAGYYHLAWVNGTAGNDTVNAADLLSSGVKAKMAELQKGVWIDGGSGNDTITGSGYGDNIRNGSGNAKIDGGANAGGKDVFEIAVDSIAAMDAVQVSVSDDPAYSFMVTYGNGQKDYLKNIEAIAINVSGSSAGKWIPLVLEFSEISADANLANASHFAWAQGTERADSFDAASVSSATKALMAQHGRGVYANMGAGDDTVVGSGYGDHIILGSGTNYLDGGANAGTTTWGGKPADVLQVNVASQAAANAVQVVALAGGMSGADAQAFADGYTHKVVAGNEIDYLKNVERVTIMVNGTTWARDVALAVQVQEAAPNDPNIGGYQHLAWVTGTGGADSIDASAAGALLSDAVTQQMTTRGKGVFIDGGAGNDTIVASAYGDNIVGGAGVNHIDGGANLGTTASGGAARDVLEMFVASQAEADAIAVTVLSAASTGADLTAFNAGYKFKVANGTAEVNYLKNVEHVNIMVWNDKDGDGQRDGLPASDPANELTSVRNIALTANSAPSFAGAPAGVAIDGIGIHSIQTGATVLADGKLLSVRTLLQGDGSPTQVILARHNADGSIDTSFGNGSGRVVVPTDGVAANPSPVQLADGKIMIGFSTTGANTDFKLIRLNADGSVDMSYGSNGAAQIDFGTGSEYPLEMLLQPDGKLVVAGAASVGVQPTKVALARLNPDGSLDTGFGSGGKQVFAPQGASTALSTLALQADGKLLVGGYVVGAAGNPDVALVRYNVDGSLDTGFGSGGTYMLPVGPGTDNVRSIVMLADGKILVGGTTRSAANDVDGFLLRLNANGTLDASFGSNGVVKAHLTDANDVFAYMARQEDGKILVFGSIGASNTSPSSGGELMVARYLPNGQLDTGFGSSGIARVPGHGIGIGADPAGMALVDGKIVIFGSTVTDLGTSSYQPVIARLNADGTLDAGFNPAPQSSVGGSVTGDGLRAVALDTNAAIYDADLHARGNYGGASLKLARQGGASSDDLFSAVGEVSFANGQLSVGGTVIGSVAQNGGTLTLSFNTAATQGLVNRALHGIGYGNRSSTPPDSVSIDWTFSDGNTGSQGLGGALSASATSQVLIGTTVREIARSSGNPANSTEGQPLSGYAFLATVNGSARGESFNADTQLSASARALMAELGRGARFDLGGGDDTLVATAYGDSIVGGPGVNHIDGGANLGAGSSGAAAQDVLEMYVASQAAADAVAVTVLSAASTGADLAAFNAGYKFKVANGTAEVNYLKNVEQVNVMVWTDKDGDGQRDSLPVNDPANEVLPGRTIALVSNTAPTFAGAPAGVAIEGVGAHYSQQGGTVLASGKLLSVRVLMAGDGSPSQTILARHNADGSVDTSFGGGTGRVVLPTQGVAINPAPVELADGKIMLAVSTPGNDFDFRVMRVNADGSLDTSFGTGGSTIVSIDAGSDLPTEVLVQPDGKVIVAGWGNASVAPYFMVATRLNTDGTLDTSFGNGGKLQYGFPNAASSMSHMVLQGDKLLVSGYVGGPDGTLDAAVLRFDSNGSLDTSFGNSGVFLQAIGVATDNARSMVVLPDGKILLGGTMRTAANDVDGFLLRLNANGTVDTGFGSAGVVKAHLTDGHDVFGHIAVQPDGKIIAYGTIGATSSNAGLGGELMVARYLANGQLDTGFGNNGVTRVPGHGIGVGADPASLVLVDGKIVIFGTTIVNGTTSHQPLIARLNSDGSLDASFYPAPAASVGGSVQANGVQPVALDTNGAIYDAELHARGNYGGASLTLARQGGASIDDLFSAVGEVSFANGQLSVAGTVIGAVVQNGGTLTLSFNSVATQGLVNRALHGVGYSNGGANPPSSVSIDWTFSDGNSGSQGFGGALAATATSQVLIGTTVREVVRSPGEPTKSTDGVLLSNYAFLANVYGSARGESFDSNTQLSAAVRTLMSELGRGARFDLGAGDDTLVATGGSDEIYAGSGTNRIDGGDHAGSYPFGGGPGRDTLHVLVADQAAANAVSVTRLTAGMSGPDAEAFAAGYEVKVVNGSEIDYVKNVEMIKIFRWADANGNRTAEGNELTWMREIPVALRVYETAVSTTDPAKATDGRLLKDIWHLATAEGWERNDRFDADTDVSNAAKQLMAQQGRGVWVDGGGGDDVLAGSAYGDNFIGGAGTNYIDGRANGGSTPTGQRAEDVLEIYVDTQARANAVQAIVLDAAATGKDAQAFADGYAWKVVDGDAVNYVRNVEAVNIFIWTDANGNHLRDAGEAPHARHIRLAASVNEISRHPTDPTRDAGGNLLSAAMHMAWVNGSAGADSFNAATDISGATLGLMDQYQRGVFVETHGGNDTVVGSAYGDNFVTGAGVNRIDGGDNRGTHPAGGGAFDMLEIYVASQAAADAVTVTALTTGMSGADADAWNDGYRYKVVNGSVSTDYIKNIEQLNVMVWTDKDGDGQRDWDSGEIGYTRSVGLTTNTAPSFAGSPRGAMVRDGDGDYGSMGGVVLADGKLMSLVYVADANGALQLALERSLADGSIDTSFGNGGRVILEPSMQSAIPPALLDNGKLLVAHRTAAGAKLLLVNPDGSLDGAFGNGGSTVLSIGADPMQPFQVLEGGGKLWVVGYTGVPQSIAVARLNQDGSLDTGFSGDGYAVLPAGNGGLARAAQVQADGKLVVVGYAQGVANRDLVALRLNSDGSLDTGFGSGGKVLLQGNPGVEALDTATSMAILPSGKILVGGYFNSSVNNSTTNDGLLVRLNADGSLDTGFGTGGRVRVPGTADNDYIFKVVPLADGSFLTLGIVGGSPASQSGNGDVTISRFRADGSLDTAFATGGSFRYTARGMGSDVGSLVVHDNKILMFGGVNNDTIGTDSFLLLRLNMDGTLDASLAPSSGSLGGVMRTDGYHWTALDTNAAIYDAELAARGNYGGATLAIERAGGANAEDLYQGVGEVSFANGQLAVGNTVVGTVGQQGGRLSIVFNNSATQELVNRALHGIGYANANPAATGATLNWQFSDGNAGGQGVGGALGASGSTTVEIGMVTWQAVPAAANPALTTRNEPIAQLAYLAAVDGSGRADSFDGATGFQPQTTALMATHGRGAFFEMGGGGDTVTGTGYSDEFVMGAGINRIDGGANAGSHPQGGAGKDQLSIFVANEAQAAAVKVIKLVAGMSGDDAAAFTAGYEAKVVNGAEIDYIRNVERVVVSLWNDADGDRIRDVNELTYMRDVPLQVRVFTINPNSATADSYHFAWIDSWARNDSVNVATDVPEATRALMDQYQRGVFIDTGAGDDTIVASAYGDNITAGPGINRVDGGANTGTAPWGGKVEDILDVYVRTTQEAGGVVATVLTAAMTGDDGAAYAAGYRWKVVSAQETDYVKNIEAVNITVWNDANGNGVRDDGETTYARQIALESRIDEVRVSTTDPNKTADGGLLVDNYHFAWARGTAGDDVIDAAAISQPTRALMDQYKRGMWGQLGDGNDRVIGSAYGDNIDLGKGVNRFDGGDDIGTRPNGSPIFDVLEVHVRSQAEADAVAVVKLSAAMTGEDAVAFGQGYVYKVTGPEQVNYIKNVEQVYVGIWNDANGNGAIDHDTEVSFSRMIDVEQNSAPRFAPPQGIAVVDHGWDFTPSGMERGPDGKFYILGAYDPEADDEYYVPFLARHNADGSVDTSFGNGAGYVPLSSASVTGIGFAMKVLADGKLIVATGETEAGATGVKVMRYHANGSLDTSFGTNGEVAIGFASFFVPTAVLAGPDGALSVAGYTSVNGSSNDFGVVRLNANGSLDTGFNGSGKLTVALSQFSDTLIDAQLQADGKLVLGGTTRSTTFNNTNDFAVARVNTNGTLDTDFGNGGKVVVSITAGGDALTAINLLPGGAILLTGNTNNGITENGGTPHAVLVKLDANGNLASGFGTNGKVYVPDATPDMARATVVQPDGKIVVAGEWGQGRQLAVTRYNPDGTLDTGFADGGRFLLSIRGMRDYATAVVLDGDKIVLQIPSYFNTGADSSLLLARLNADGSLDTSFAPGPFDTLGSVTKANGVIPMVLDHNAMIYDAELAARGSYGGASVRVERQGGRDADDVFSLVGEVSASGGQLSVGGVVVGTVVIEPGMLRLDFNDAATQGLVNRALHGIAYANKAANPPSSVTIGWRFEDGNGHSEQGGGGIGIAHGQTTVEITAVADEVKRSWEDPSRSSDNRPLSSLAFFATVTGSRIGDDFAADDLSPQVKALMAEFGRGATYQMLGGGDTVTGTGFSDEFIMGKGVNHVDGGANVGSSPYGNGPGEDTLIVYVPDQAAADAVRADMLTPLSIGADADAYRAGYEAKIVSGDQVDYIRNVEQVSVHLWTDTNGNGIVDGTEGSYLHNIQFRTHVSGRKVSTPDATTDVNGQVLANQWHFAWASGIDGDDLVNVEQSLNSDELALMNQYQRGAWVNLGKGNDVVTATAYGDNINVGTGTNWVDGGANGGTTPNGSPVNDVLEINTASLAERKTVSFQVLTTGMSGDDALAYAAGYQFKVVAPGQTDYVKNVELLAINVWNDANGNGQREDSEISEQIWVTPDLNAQGIVVIGTPQG